MHIFLYEIFYCSVILFLVLFKYHLNLPLIDLQLFKIIQNFHATHGSMPHYMVLTKWIWSLKKISLFLLMPKWPYCYYKCNILTVLLSSISGWVQG